MLENGIVVCMCNFGFSGKICMYLKNRCCFYLVVLCLKGGECIVNFYCINIEVCLKDWDGFMCRNEFIFLF